MSPKKSPLFDESQILNLLEEALNSNQDPADLCADFPELIGEVKRRLNQLRGTEAHLDAIFPPLGFGRAQSRSSANELPQIPGYEVHEILGRGGMGIVYRVRNVKLNRDEALKMLLAGAYASQMELIRFVREAEAVAAFRHLHIVQIYGAGEVDGRPYFTMEFVEGGSLAQKIVGGAPPVRESAKLLAMLARAVETAHKGGIVHRDLKPANILLTEDGTPKITDFGLARRVDMELDLTLSGTKLGTLSYMAPEQVVGSIASIGPAVDIHALGAILYEMLAGTPPFSGDSPAETEKRLINEDAKPLSQVSKQVPRDLETICLKCLQKDPMRRYSTAAELANDLDRFLRHEPINARPISKIERSVRWARRKPMLVALILTIGILCSTLVAGGVRALAFAARQRVDEARLTAKWEAGVQLLRQGRFAEARDAIGRLSDGGFEGLAHKIENSLSELKIVDELDAISLSRISVSQGHYDMQKNKVAADRLYKAMFEKVGVGKVHDDAKNIAQRINLSDIKVALVAALDDWAVCALDKKNRDWILEVARKSDPDPKGWRDQVRNSAKWDDRVALIGLAKSAPVADASVQLLTALGDRLDTAEVDSIPFRMQVQQQHAGDFLANFSIADAMRERDPAESLRFYQAALAVRPRAAPACNNLGLALAALGRFDEAIVHYKQALSLDLKFMLAHYNLGLAYAAIGRSDDAIIEFEQAIQIDRAFAFSHYNLALMLRGKAQTKDAIRHFQSAIAIDPNYAPAHYNLGLALRDAAKFAEAVAEFQVALKLDNKSSLTERFLALSLADCGETDAAVYHYHEALRLDPDDVDSYIGLGRVLMSKNQHTEAASQFQKALDLNPDSATTHYNLGLILRSIGRRKEAIDQFQSAIHIDPSYAPAHYNLGLALREASKLADAVAELRAALKLDPTNALAARFLAITLVDLGRLEEAVPYFQEAVKLDPNDAGSHIELGRAFMSKDRKAEAAIYFQKALEINPDSASTHYNLALILRATGQGKKAIDHLRSTLNIDPNNVYAHYNLGLALRDADKPDEAISEFTSAIKLDPSYTSAYRFLGLTLSETGRPNDAIENYRAALKIDPSDVETLNELGKALVTTGRLDESVVYYKQAISLNPNFMPAHFNLGLAYAASGKSDDAILEFEQALRIDPSFGFAHYNLALALRTRARTTEAIEHFRKVLDVDPNYMPAHYNLGLSLREAGDFDEAVIELMETVKLDPNHAPAHRVLGITLLDIGKPKDAVDSFNEALKADPSDVNLLNDLGRALVMAGQYDEGIEAYERALKFDPKNTHNLNDCGVVLRKVGRLKEAQEYFGQTLRLYPDDTYALYQLGITLIAEDKRATAIEHFKHVIQVDAEYFDAYGALGEALLETAKVTDAEGVLQKSLEIIPESDPHREIVLQLLEKCKRKRAEVRETSDVQ